MSDTVAPLGGAAPALRPTAPAEPTHPAWPAVLSLSLGVFGLVTAEFLPVSLLTPIAADLGVSNGGAGQAVTATAIVAAFAGPAIVIGTARIDRRIVVWSLSLLLVLSNLLAAAADHIAILIGARVALGIALGGFWSLAAALTLRLVPARLMPRAMSIIFTGVSAATVTAAPLGAFLGDLWGWRPTFLAASLLGAAALATQLATMPRLPPADAPGLGTFALVLRRPAIRIGLLTVLLVIAGHFAGFTYVRPFLETVPRFDVATISLVLLAFGIGGFFGNLAGGAVAERSPRRAVALGSLALSLAVFALLAFGAVGPVAFAATALWGFAFGAFPVGIQSWTTRSAPDHAESAGALLVTTFQIAIASGAVAGGLLVNGFGAGGAIALCAVATLAGGLTMLLGARAHEA
ncbi:MFS transporter [Aureimonas endophytica]|uniref:MFS transporter n=1 Tax=Aureimonas endophytica TaxID=2027858 RepID=A0A917A4B3_9HYPH|nr:MFS transporter [Aureimonas endophytica]GGE22978.1 MFS transporter [Aureimonas endophytica]